MYTNIVHLAFMYTYNWCQECLIYIHVYTYMCIHTCVHVYIGKHKNIFSFTITPYISVNLRTFCPDHIM